MVNELISALILAVIQGATEWFPVSSSGHLVLFESILNYIRQIRTITNGKIDKEYDGINGDDATKLDKEICKCIYEIIRYYYYTAYLTRSIIFYLEKEKKMVIRKTEDNGIPNAYYIVNDDYLNTAQQKVFYSYQLHEQNYYLIKWK